MTSQPSIEPSERIQTLIDTFAGQVVGAGTQDSGWRDALRELGKEAERTGHEDLAADVLRIESEMSVFEADSPGFLETAEKAVERLCQMAKNEHHETAVSEEASAIAQDPELIADFIFESREHLRAIEQHVLAVEQESNSTDAIHAMFRAFHTIKGIAGFLELKAIRDVSHETETLLDLARNNKLTLTPPIIDLILESADYLSREVTRLEAGNGEPSAPCAQLIDRLQKTARGEQLGVQAELRQLSQAMAPAELPEQPAPAEAELPAAEQKTGGAKSGTPAASTVKVDTAKLDFLVDAVGEMVIAQSLIQNNPDLTKVQSAALMRSVAQLSRITSEVQKAAMSMRMVPIRSLFQKMGRLVRDLCRKAGKQAELITYGDETELDRNIVEELADPLMHMLRNALDHGIESPSQRITAGKPATAKVQLRAAHQGGHILIEISDDGRGINRDAVLRKATERGLVAPGATLSDSEVFALIFEPGFSTAEKITDISGRGVGMDVVKKHIQNLRGTIETHSIQGQGTTFRLKLPLTLAIIDGLVVGVGEERYIVPIFAVKEMLRPSPGMISTIENKSEIALIRDRVLPVVRLHRRFEVTPATEDPEQSLLIIAESQETDFCLMVDHLIGKQEVVIKSLGESMKNIPGVAGGAILGDGRVALILEMDAIFHPGRAA